MDIDQRIEALTQSLELMTSLQRDSEERWDKRFRQLLEMSERTDRRIEVILDLVNSHEQRLGNLERGQS